MTEDDVRQTFEERPWYTTSVASETSDINLPRLIQGRGFLSAVSEENPEFLSYNRLIAHCE